MSRLLLSVVLLGSILPVYAQSATPAVDGYVTNTVSATDFSVDGFKIICDEKTVYLSFGKKEPESQAPWANGPFLGERLSIFGEEYAAVRTIRAARIVLGDDGPHKVAGFGMIDRVLSSPSQTPGSILIRADGYPILVDAKTVSTFKPPLASLAGVSTNMWIVYAGMQGADGIVVASRADFRENAIPRGEGKLRAKTDYDPEAVSPNDRQGRWSKTFHDIDPKRIPAYPDAAMQARVARIGANLVPEYQRALPNSDPTKILFRFEVIDAKTETYHFRLMETPEQHDAIALSSGIVLIPKKIVERMESDAQLATVLADGIAGTLVKQQYRFQSAARKMLAAEIAGDVAGTFVPFADSAAGFGNLAASAKMNRHNEEQRGRISLGLLADAGYDIDQAPQAWWRLAPKKPAELTEIPIPYRAKYLYRILGTTWRDYRPANK